MSIAFDNGLHTTRDTLLEAAVPAPRSDEEPDMTKGTVDADAILNRARPLVRRQAPEHVVDVPLALAV